MASGLRNAGSRPADYVPVHWCESLDVAVVYVDAGCSTLQPLLRLERCHADSVGYHQLRDDAGKTESAQPICDFYSAGTSSQIVFP